MPALVLGAVVVLALAFAPPPADAPASPSQAATDDASVARAEDAAPPRHATIYVGPIAGLGSGWKLGGEAFAGYRFENLLALGYLGDGTATFRKNAGRTRVTHRHRLATAFRFGPEQRGQVMVAVGAAFAHFPQVQRPTPMATFAADLAFFGGRYTGPPPRARVGGGIFVDVGSPTASTFNIGVLFKVGFGIDG